jgi:hypothetical protein
MFGRPASKDQISKLALPCRTLGQEVEVEMIIVIEKVHVLPLIAALGHVVRQSGNDDEAGDRRHRATHFFVNAAASTTLSSGEVST